MTKPTSTCGLRGLPSRPPSCRERELARHEPRRSAWTCGRWRRSQAVPCPRNRLRSDRRTPYRPAMRTSRAAADKARARFAPCTRSTGRACDTIAAIAAPPRARAAGLAFRFVTPRRDPTPAMTITDKVGLQPLRQRMLTTGARQAIGNQHQCPLAERDAIAASAPASLRHHMIKTELIPELTYRQDRPPIPRPNGGNARAAHGSISPRIAVQQTGKLLEIKMPRQQIPAAEIDDRVVTGLAAGVAIGFDHAYVFAFDALADGRSDQAQKHGPIARTSGRTCPC